MPPVFDKCPICQYGAFLDEDNTRDIFRVNCLRCGPFRYELEAITISGNNFSDDNRLLVSSKINEFSRLKHVYTDDDIERILNTSVPSVDERAINLLLCFADHYPGLGEVTSLSIINQILTKGTNLDKTDYNDSKTKFVLQILSRSFSNNRKELMYLIEDYHISETGYIIMTNNDILEISPKGWTRLDELKYKQQESNIGFIAMKFLPELEEYAKKWFEGGIKDAGYEAEAMYDHPHLNLIDNEMIALIRRSKFLVCDMTKNSRGAYYEAGFAHGLNIPVIFLCEKGFFENKDNELSTNDEGVHFDTNHYPIIVWEHDKGEQLQNKLHYWIEKTIGRGLLKD